MMARQPISPADAAKLLQAKRETPQPDKSGVVIARVPAPADYPGDWLKAAIERGKKEPFAIVADIGPAEALALLSNNPENRNVTAKSAARLVRDIAGGRWQFNGESIVVADTGELNDGQHRLAAVANTGVAIRSVIVFGVPRASRETLDTGRSRDLSDWLALHGITSAALTAATTRRVMNFEASKGATLDRTTRFSQAEHLERAINDTLIHAAVKHAHVLTNPARDLIPGSIIATCLYLTQKIDPHEATHFIDRVCIGDLLEREDAAFRTRRALMLTSEKRAGLLGALVLRGWALHCYGYPNGLVPENPIPPLDKPAK